MAKRSIRSRRGRKRVKDTFELQLTSLMDVFVIVLVFLLKSYATSQHNFTSVPGLQLPFTASQDDPADSLQVIITPAAIHFESERVVEFQATAPEGGTEPGYMFKAEDLDEGGRRVPRLFAALIAAKEKSELLRAKSSARDAEGKPLPFDGVLAIQADKRVEYDTVRKIMYTAAAAGYRTFRFLALKREG